jgi:ankyrin repeat protein
MNVMSVRMSTREEIFETLATYDNNTLRQIVTEAVQKNCPNMLDIVQIALRIGLDINKSKLIKLAIIEKNLNLFLLCIKEKAELLNVTGKPLLHVAAQAGNVFAIKYLCKKLDVNAENKSSYTALDVACMCKNTMIVDILLQNNALSADRAAERFLEELQHYYYNKKFPLTNETIIILTKLISNKIIKMPTLINYATLLMVHKDKLFLEKIIKYYPEIVKERFSSDCAKTSMLLTAVETNNEELVQQIVDLIQESDILSDNCCGTHVLHNACGIGNVNIVNSILSKCKSCINIKDKDQRTAIDHAFSKQSIIKGYQKTEDDIIKIIRKLVSCGCDINSKDDDDIGSLIGAIQEGNYNIVSEMIKLGCEVNNTARSKIDRFWVPLQNGDLVGFAIECNKIDICKLLIEKGAKLLFIMDNSYKLYTSVLIAIMDMSADILEYLLQIDEIKQTLDASTKKYLLKLAISDGCCDNRILQMFAPDNTQVSQIMISEIKGKLNKKRCDTYFERRFNNYVNMNDDARMQVLEMTYIILSVISSAKRAYIEHKTTTCPCCGTKSAPFYRHKSGDYSKYVNKMFRNIDNLFDTFDNNDIDNEIINDIIDIIHIRTEIPVEILGKLYNRLLHLYKNRNNTFYHDDESKTITDINLYIETIINNKVKLDRLEAFPYFIEHMIDEKEETNDDADAETYIIDRLDSQARNNRDREIKHQLTRMIWPFTVSHYKRMYDLLFSSFDSHCLESDKFMSASIKSIESSQQIEYTIIKLKSKSPSIFFDQYGKNIGKDEKLDDFHMFPFVFDKKLSVYPCIVREVKDPTDPSGCGNNTMLYFYGKMTYQKSQETAGAAEADRAAETVATSETILGCYEFFINSRKTLFHRIFKPIHKLPDDVVAEIKKKKYRQSS